MIWTALQASPVYSGPNSGSDLLLTKSTMLENLRDLFYLKVRS